MDVEKRMALSLDQIIKQKSGREKENGNRGPGKKGRGRVKIAKLSDQVKTAIKYTIYDCFVACNHMLAPLSCPFTLSSEYFSSVS